MEKSVHSAENAVLLELLVTQRKHAGWTQVQLAEALEMTQSAYSKLERGELRIDLIQLRSILATIGVSLVDFVTQLEQELAKANRRGKRGSTRGRK